MTFYSALNPRTKNPEQCNGEKSVVRRFLRKHPIRNEILFAARQSFGSCWVKRNREVRKIIDYSFEVLYLWVNKNNLKVRDKCRGSLVFLILWKLLPQGTFALKVEEWNRWFQTRFQNTELPTTKGFIMTAPGTDFFCSVDTVNCYSFCLSEGVSRRFVRTVFFLPGRKFFLCLLEGRQIGLLQLKQRGSADKRRGLSWARGHRGHSRRRRKQAFILGLVSRPGQDNTLTTTKRHHAQRQSIGATHKTRLNLRRCTSWMIWKVELLWITELRNPTFKTGSVVINSYRRTTKIV